MFKALQQLFGPTAATSFNLGLCMMGLNPNTEVLAAMIEAGTLDPAFEPARQMREKLKNK